jgi:transposase InsO family protein
LNASRELYAGVTRYFHHDNSQRPHQALGYKTPEAIYYANSQLAKALIIR